MHTETVWEGERNRERGGEGAGEREYRITIILDAAVNYSNSQQSSSNYMVIIAV